MAMKIEETYNIYRLLTSNSSDFMDSIMSKRLVSISVTFVRTGLLLSLLVIAHGWVVGQTNHNVQIIADHDYLIILVDSLTPIPLNGFELIIPTGNGAQRIIRLQDAFPLVADPNTSFGQGTCFMYQRTGSSVPLPTQCSGPHFGINLAEINVFWWNDASVQSYDLKIQNSICALSGAPGCAVAFVTPTPTATPGNSIIIQGSNNLGTVQKASLDSVIEQTGIRAWRDIGLSGQYQRIGVLEHHFGGLLTFEAQAGVAVSLPPGDDAMIYSTDNIRLGIHALEVIHTIAPNASLYACRYDDYVHFSACIDWMIDAEVNIINHPVSIPVQNPNSQSEWSQVAARAVNNHILWIDAAGNFEGSRYTNVFLDNNQNRLNEFLGIEGFNEVLAFEAIPHLSGTVMLSWGNFGSRLANQIDLNLRVYDPATDQDIARSERVQRGNTFDTALESVTFEMARPFAIQIIDQSGNSNGVPLTLLVEFGRIPIQDAGGSIYSTGDSPLTITVGALQGAQVAPYSSRGPVEGANKPDLVAPAEIQLNDGTIYMGTSAAASVVTGFAALLWERYPALSRQEIQEFILNDATIDVRISQIYDINYGQGIFQVTPVVSIWTPTATPSPSETPIPFVTPAPSPTLTDTPTLQTGLPIAIVKVESAYLRGGPGVEYDVRRAAFQTDQFIIAGEAYGWYVLEGSSSWIASSLVEVIPAGAQIPPAANVPPFPTSLTPVFTPTFLPTPTSMPGRPDEPGEPQATRTLAPPPGQLTPVISATPNETATQQVRETATRYADELTATATIQFATLTQLPIDQTATATLWTPTPIASPTINATITTFTPTPDYLATGAALATMTRNAIQVQIAATRPTVTQAIPSATPTPVPNQACTPAIPNGWVTYTVRAGDTISALTIFTDTDESAFRAANCKYDNLIIPGDTLYLRTTPPLPRPTDTPTPVPVTDGSGQNDDGPIPDGEPISISASIGGAGPYGENGGQGCYATLFVTVTGVESTSGNVYVSNGSYQPPGNLEIPNAVFPRGTSSHRITLGGAKPQYVQHSASVQTGIGSASAGPAFCGPELTPTPLPPPTPVPPPSSTPTP